jgi:23S rRNA pseudouridine2605 synthase
MEKKKEQKKEYRGDKKRKSTNRTAKKTIKTAHKKKFKSKQKHEAIEKELVRLNKYIAMSGICARREADELIKKGLVKVNGKPVSEMGLKVKITDKVVVNGKLISPEKKVYILINKPKDYISTVDDPHAEKTVMDLVKNATKERIYPVGRLDRNTTGVLLLTNDGDLTKKLTHPSSNKKKIYRVTLDKAVSKADMEKIAEGFELDDGFIKADAISYIEDRKKEVGIELHSGRNRIVRRVFEHLNYKVIKLDRVYFAGLTKKNLSRGKWRFLSEKEISMLKMGAYE